MKVATLVFGACSSSLLCDPTAAHDRHFAGHPEWDDLWPDPFTLNDLKGSIGGSNGAAHIGGSGGGPPDLSGVWTGSPLAAPNSRMFLTPSGGGYGSSKDRSFSREAPAPPGTAYDVRCITNDYTHRGDISCGWDSARVTVKPINSKHGRRRKSVWSGGSSGGESSTSVVTADADTDDPQWTATFEFTKGGAVVTTLSGAILGGNLRVAMDPPWDHFTGALTGLWEGPNGDVDYYVLTHNETSGNLTVAWDTSQTAAGGWYTGDGTFNATTGFVDMHFDAFELTGEWWVAVGWRGGE